MKIEKVKIELLKLNPANPRTIKDEKFAQLVRSVRGFPQMLEIRPIVVNSKMEVLGGNMRLRACIEAGLKEVPIIRAENLTDDQQREFIIKDNVGFGEWDWDALANDWDAAELADWGLDVPSFDVPDYSGKNQEVDTDAMPDEMVMAFKFTQEQYFQVKEALSGIAETPENALLTLIDNARTQVPV
jgi:hypothetical protein